RQGFQFFAHDAEHTLLNPDENRLGPFDAPGAERFNPQTLHQALMQNVEYRQLFFDRMQQHLFNGGALTTQASLARYNARATEIETAIIAESARWGDEFTGGGPLTKDNWIGATNYARSVINVRTDKLLAQLRAANWFPSMNAPVFKINDVEQYG